MTINFYTSVKYLFVTNVTSVPTLKADLDKLQWKKWGHAKVEIGDGEEISTASAIEKLIDFYNNNKGRRII
jgi:NADPH-dependent ferric siderophore reductase